MIRWLKPCCLCFVLAILCLAEWGCDRTQPVKEHKPIVPASATVTSSGPPAAKTNTIKNLEARASKGEAAAQFSLGLAYATGQNVAQDYDEAVVWYRKAAEQGNVRAETILGLSYQNGQGLPQDYVQAATWLRKAAEQDGAEAQYSLGLVYAAGEGVPRDQAMAIKWLRASAEHGFAPAQCALGGCYALGEWVPRNLVQAASWYRKAAAQDDAKGQYHLGLLFAQGEGLYNDQSQALIWFRKAADKGYADAQFALAQSYYNGQGTPLNYAEALKWARKAAGQGHAKAQLCLADAYFRGRGVTRDYAEAYKWVNLVVGQSKPVDWLKCTTVAAAPAPVPLVTINHKMLEPGESTLVKTPSGNMTIKCLSINGNAVQIMVEGETRPITLRPGSKGERADFLQAALDFRTTLERQMIGEQVSEGQRRSSCFMETNRLVQAGDDDLLPEPGLELQLPKTSLYSSSYTPRGAVEERRSSRGEHFGSSGTGFFVTDDGYFVTCAHVVRGAYSFQIKSGGISLPAKLVKEDAAHDLALLKSDGTFHALPIAFESGIKLGDGVFTIGFPNHVVQGVEPKLTRGEISSLAGIRDDPHYFQISVPVQPGNSGGALIDEHGNVVGVVAARLNDVTTYQMSGALPQNVNYAIKSDLLCSFLNQVPGLRDKLKVVRTANDQGAANTAAERAAVLVIAE